MLRFDLQGLDEVEAALNDVADRLNPVHIVDEAAALLLARIRARFLEEKSPLGGKWVPSFAATLRASSGRGGGTLYDTGKLFNSIQVFADSENSRKVGTDVEYASAHQHGIGQVKREFIGASEEDTQLMVGLVVMRIKKALK